MVKIGQWTVNRVYGRKAKTEFTVVRPKYCLQSQGQKGSLLLVSLLLVSLRSMNLLLTGLQSMNLLFMCLRSMSLLPMNIQKL